MEHRIFSPEQAAQLTAPFPERILQCIKKQEIHEAISICEEMKHSRILLHDFFADSCTMLWSWIGEHLGEEKIEEMFRYIFSQSAQRQYYDALSAQVMPHLTVYLLAKSWRAHSCFGVGDFPAKFSITEDDEKFSFRLHPCGSGARLWLKGRYSPGKGGKTSEKKRPWTYNRKGFPYYCIHCPFLNEILPYESGYGRLMWPVDPLKTPDGECVWHLYKNPDKVPDTYYKRLGLEKKPAKQQARFQKNRHFSDLELSEMARPSTDRIIESLKNGSLSLARKRVKEVKDEFLVLHDLYAMMLSATFTFIADQAGESALGDALNFQFQKCIATQMLQPITRLPVKEKALFLATKIFGVDSCNGTGYFKARFSIKETNSEVIFVLSPCGSGGRLLRAGSYAPIHPVRKMIEKLENKLVAVAAQHIPFPESMLKLLFPLIVTHFTQRKPYSQGATRKPRKWSFDKAGTPYYCCQCGKLQEKLGDQGLHIIPPKHKRDVCIWKLRKSS